MPTALIWRAQHAGENDQVGIKTDKYYFSFCTTRCVRDRDISRLAIEPDSPWDEPGSFVISEALDTYLQHGRSPDRPFPLRNVSDDDINTWYEEFLKKHVVIGDRAVDRETVADILDRKNVEEAQELIGSNYDHYVNLLSIDAKVRHSCFGHVLIYKPFKGIYRYLDRWYRFYTRPQHSVTFAYNVIASLDNYPDMPFRVRYGDFRGPGGQYYMHPFNAAVFESIAEEYFTRERIPPPDHSLIGILRELPMFGNLFS